MKCAFHRRARPDDCSDDCPMQGMFNNYTEFNQLYNVLGVPGVFKRFFEKRTEEQRLSVAAALWWATCVWRSNPKHGPLGAFNVVDRKVRTLRDRHRFVEGAAPPNFKPEAIVVPFGPKIQTDRTICLFHRRVGGGPCNDDCIFRPIFPASSNETAFDIIYGMFGEPGDGIIPRFFQGIHDPDSRRYVAASLIWDAQSWTFDPVHGPRGRYVNKQRILASLHAPQPSNGAVWVFGVDLRLPPPGVAPVQMEGADQEADQE